MLASSDRNDSVLTRTRPNGVDCSGGPWSCMVPNVPRAGGRMTPSHWHVGTSKCELQDAASSRVTGKGVTVTPTTPTLPLPPPWKGGGPAARRSPPNVREIPAPRVTPPSRIAPNVRHTPIAHGPKRPSHPHRAWPQTSRTKAAWTPPVAARLLQTRRVCENQPDPRPDFARAGGRMPPSHWHVGTSWRELQDAASPRVTGKGVNTTSRQEGLHDAAPRTFEEPRTTC